MKKTDIPLYCGVQDPDKYAALAAAFNAKRGDAAGAMAFAMHAPLRRAAMLATMAQGRPLSVEMCEEFSPDTVPQLRGYLPKHGQALTPEQIAAAAEAQAKRVEAGDAERARQLARPANFSSFAEACSYFGRATDALDKWLEANPWAKSTIR